MPGRQLITPFDTSNVDFLIYKKKMIFINIFPLK